MNAPIIQRVWRTDGQGRIAIEWRVFGLRVFGYSFLPWEVPADQPWATPKEYFEGFKRVTDWEKSA